MAWQSVQIEVVFNFEVFFVSMVAISFEVIFIFEVVFSSSLIDQPLLDMLGSSNLEQTLNRPT